jgi:hypothetical protein
MNLSLPILNSLLLGLRWLPNFLPFYSQVDDDKNWAVNVLFVLKGLPSQRAQGFTHLSSIFCYRHTQQ